MTRRPTRLVLAALALFVACNDDNSAPTAPVAVASPSPTPAPTPTPRILGQGVGCGLPRKPECGDEEGPTNVWGCCARGGEASWTAEIWEAIERLRSEQPGLFDGDRVLDREKYMLGVATIVERDFGLCAIPGGPGDEIGVKKSNDFSEQYDIYLSNGRVRYPAYQVICRPARF